MTLQSQKFYSAQNALEEPLNRPCREENSWKTDVPCPWNLSGRWAMTPYTHITIRHWSFLQDLLWSTQEYKGNETFIGSLEHDVATNRWRVVARFGSAHDCIGRLESNGLVIVWETGDSWTRLESTSAAPQRIRSALRSSSLWCHHLSSSNRLRIVGRSLILGGGLLMLSYFAFLIVSTLGKLALNEAIALAKREEPPAEQAPFKILGSVLILSSAFMIVTIVRNRETLFPPPRPSRNSSNDIISAIISGICEAFVSAFIVAFQLILLAGLIMVFAVAALLGVVLSVGTGIAQAIVFALVCLFAMTFLLCILILALMTTFEKLSQKLGFASCYQAMWRTQSTFSPIHWPGVSLLLPEHPEYQRVVQLFQANCEPTRRMYPFSLSVIEIYKVQNESLEKQYQSQCTNLQNIARGAPTANALLLFHGTSVEATQKIIFGGFKLPSNAGMFGKGVYFAESPQKSWQYCQNRGGYMLACDVALGNCKDLYKASSGLNPSRDLRRGGLFAKLGFRKQPDYDSIRAVPQSDGGAVRAVEYAIYNPGRAIPRYLLKVSEVRASCA